MNSFFYERDARSLKKPFIVIVLFKDFGKIGFRGFKKMGQAERWLNRRLAEIEEYLDAGEVVEGCVYHCPTKTIPVMAEAEGKFSEKVLQEIDEAFGEDF